MADDFETSVVDVADVDSTAIPAQAAVPADSAIAEQTGPVRTVEERLASLTEQYEMVEKERNDLKGQVTGRQRAADRDDAIHSRLDNIQTNSAGLHRSMAVILEHLAAGDEDPQRLKTELAAIQEETADLATIQEADEQWKGTYSQYLTDMNELLSDGKGGLILSPAGPELADAAKAWNAANTAKDRVGMERALRLTERAITKSKEASPRDRRSDLEMAPSAGGGAAGAKTTATRDDISAMTTDEYVVWRNAQPA